MELEKEMSMQNLFCIQLMIEFSNYDKAIIVSGDGDFACLIDFLQKKDKLKSVIVPDEFKYSALLKKYSKPDDNIIHFMNRSKRILSKV